MLAAAFAAGIVAAHFLPIPLILMLTGGALSTLAALSTLSRNNNLATAFVTFAVFCSAGILAATEKRSVPQNQLKLLLDKGVIVAGDPVELTGVIDGPPESGPESLYLTLRVQKVRGKDVSRRALGVVQLLAQVPDENRHKEFDSLELRYGARINVMVRLDRSDDFRNPGVSSFTEYLDRKGYDATGVIKSPLLIERLDDERVFLPLAWLYQWRQRLEEKIQSHFSLETAGVLDASLLGNRYNLSPGAAERFRDAGTFHVLVISGLHISFIGGVVLLITRRLTKRRFWQVLWSATVLWCYAFAVGAQGSVVRAALMFTLVVLAPLVSRRASSLNALGAAALLLLILKPGDLFDPSFQLTFLSVLAIVVIAWPLLKRMGEIGSWRPTRDKPHPPLCAPWLRSLCEALFWSEREWKQEIDRSNFSYKLFKAPWATVLERYRMQRPLRHMVAAIVVSTSVQLELLPVLILYFHRVSLVSIILNIGVGLLMAALAAVALLALLMAEISTQLAAPFVNLANLLNWLMVHSVDPFAKAGLASVRLPEYTGWMACVYALFYVPLAALTFSLARWNPLRAPLTLSGGFDRVWRAATEYGAIAQLALILLILLHPLSAIRTDGRLRVDFLDVGQGDSALVTMPDGTTLLVDGGGRPNFRSRRRQTPKEGDEPLERDTRSIGDAVVSEYLWWRGLDHVDYVLATHADADHIEGLNAIVRNFAVRAAFVARTPPDDPEYTAFVGTLRARRVPLNIIRAEDVLRFGDVTAAVLWPPPAGDRNAPSRNNDSIVLRLRFGERSILMTGDIEQAAEAEIVNSGVDLSADLIKVAHHGSKTSSTASFVAAVHPRVAVISVGLTSVFGHPSKAVVERWQSSGAEALTTGNSGTITVTTDGHDLKIQTYVGKPGGS
jgi:competence protein ComEC